MHPLKKRKKNEKFEEENIVEVSENSENKTFISSFYKRRVHKQCIREANSKLYIRSQQFSKAATEGVL